MQFVQSERKSRTIYPHGKWFIYYIEEHGTNTRIIGEVEWYVVVVVGWLLKICLECFMIGKSIPPSDATCPFAGEVGGGGFWEILALKWYDYNAYSFYFSESDVYSWTKHCDINEVCIHVIPMSFQRVPCWLDLKFKWLFQFVAEALLLLKYLSHVWGFCIFIIFGYSYSSEKKYNTSCRSKISFSWTFFSSQNCYRKWHHSRHEWTRHRL